MNIDSTNNDIIPIEDSDVQQISSLEDIQQDKVITLNEADDNSDDMSTAPETSCWSKHRSLINVCAFGLFTSIAMSIGILTVCFTSPKQTDKTCQINFQRTVSNAMGYDSRPRYVAVGDFNKDNYLDMVVASSGTDNIGVLLGYQNGTFARQMTYSTGLRSRPYSVAVGDFNNDTRIDVVVANYGTNSIGVLLGDGNGTFASPIITQIGSSSPLSLAVAHFNNDKYLDIAVVNYGTSSISILLGYNNGSFQIGTSYDKGYDSIPYSTVIDDLNNDGQLDIATVNYGTSTLIIILRDGNETFTSLKYSTGKDSHPTSVAVGDYNNDNILDLAVTNSGTSNIGIFLGGGDGDFNSIIIQPLTSRSSPQFMVVSDFNKDNILDMVVANTQGDNVLVLKGHGNGSFSLITTHSTGHQSGPCFIAVGDFDNDNRPDIAIVNNGTNNILVLTAYAIYPDTTQTSYSTGQGSKPFSVAVGHFNNDNHLDIVVANHDSNNIGIFIGLGNGTFGSQEILYTKENSIPYYVVVGNFNNDNQDDIVFVMYGLNAIGILLGYGNRTFKYGNTYSTGDVSLPISVAVGNLNNDVNLDIAVANYNAHNIGILYGYGDGNFTNITTFFIRSDFYSSSISIGDVNSDSILDIVVSNQIKNDIAIFLGSGNGSFFISVIISTNDGFTPAMSIGDLNKDNHLDIVYTSRYGSSIGVLLGYGNGTFGSVTKYKTGSVSWPWGVALGHCNNDTVLDIAITNEYDYNIGIFFGFGNGSFAAQKTFSTGYGSRPTTIAFGDLNGDNQSDLVVGNAYADNIGIFLVHHDADFTSETTYFTGSSPHPCSVAVGAFDNDGQLDVVVANSGNDDIQILLDFNKGIFIHNRTYSTGFGSDPQFVAVADFNKDTQLDIAVANVGNDSINIFVGLGNGTYATPTIHPIGSGSFPNSIAVGDFNNDSWMDIVIANRDKDNVGVFLGFDYPTFTNQTIHIPGLYPIPIYITVGDFNHDHHCDMVVANTGPNEIGVFLGYGNGTFAEQISYSTGPSSTPVSIAIGDFNNDTHLDIAVANRAGNNIGIFLGYGNGSFATQVTYSTGNASNSVSIAAADLNKDNTLDIVVTNRNGNNIGVFIGYGNGTFPKQVSYSMPYGSSPSLAAVCDVNNDNILDIIVANYLKSNIGILLGYGDGTFRNVTTYSTGENSVPYSIATGDLNKDSWMDIAVTVKDKYVGVFFGYGNGTFSPPSMYWTGPQSSLYSIIIKDLNNDTILDIAVTDYGSGNSNIGVLYGSGDGNFTALKTYATGLNSDPISIAICDFDEDDRVDLAISYYNKDSIGIMLRSNSEPFATLTTFSTGNTSRPQSVAVGDFNNNNHLDIAVANSGTNNIGILLGYGNGTFTEQQTYSTGKISGPVSIAVGYIDNNNQLDIVVANSNTNNIVILFGSYDGTFGFLTSYSTGQSSAPSSIAVHDLNKDNYLDIVVTTYGTNKLFVFFGLGNGTFSKPNSTSLSYNARPQSITIGDFNNDTLLDIAIANSGTDYVEVLLQTC